MIRPVQRDELSSCASLIRKSFQTVADEFGFTPENAPRFTAFATTEERLLFHLDGEHRLMFLDEENGIPCGYYSLRLQENGSCDLGNLAVLPEYRHRGIGGLLLRHAIETARAHHCDVMELSIVEENQVLRRWYERNGAIHTGTEKFDFFPFTCGYLKIDLQAPPAKKIQNIAIVSLSSGIIGEPSVQFEVDIGVRRLQEYGLNVKFMPHARMGLQYVCDHPKERAEDLLTAFRDPDIDMILCAIGGDDTYRLLPYLFDHNELAEAVSNKVFLGFSDTTINHLMLHKTGLKTFYGQAFLSDLCELSPEMHPYTRKYFEELITTGHIREITPSDCWYSERQEFSPYQVGKMLPSHPNAGFELLQGSPVFSGKILGGCIDSMFDFFDPGRYADMPVLCSRYRLFPDAEDWKGRILLLESSEEKPTPEVYRKSLEYLKGTGVFDAVSGVLAGKPMDETYADEYKKLLVEVIGKPDLPIVFNLNIGHAMPRCIMPFGVEATVDVNRQVIRFAE